MLLLVLASQCAGRHELRALWNRMTGDAYALDAISRELPRGAVARCPDDVAVVDYRGDAIAYASPVKVAPQLVPKLRALERLIADIAIVHYGRPPTKLLHFGARVCRAVRGRSGRLSEHALGNAIDVSGFQFERMREAPPPDAPPELADPRLREAFMVSVRRHWVQGSGPLAETHAEFLRTLVGRVIAKGLFRGVVGPGHEGHADHFHFDQAPWKYALF